MISVIAKAGRRMKAAYDKTSYWLWLRRRVTGRIKLRGNIARISIHSSFRCDGDLWLGVYSNDGAIAIEAGVSASGPLIVTAIRPLRIGAGTIVGPNVLITDHYHGDIRDAAHRVMPPSMRPLHSPGAITIAENVHFGANVVVLAPASVGHGVIVAANTVLKGTISAMTVHTGLAIRDGRGNSAPGVRPGE